jgi:hypothetical protein
MWLKEFSRLFVNRPSTGRRTRPQAQRPRVARLALEHLEDRLAPSGGAHAPIVIRSDADFVSSNCVISGNGTVSSPYIIGPWTINSGTGDAVFIDGTNLTKSFVLDDLTIAGTPAPTSRGIVHSNINLPGHTPILAEVSGPQTSIQQGGVGILVTNSNNVTLDGGGANPNGPGISQPAGTINQNTVGAIDVENSSHITVTGWQLSANGVDGQPDWLAFDPSLSAWGVGGVRFFGVTDSVIDHNSANNCTSISYSLFNSSHNTVTENTGDYPFTMNFLVTDGSSYNTLNGNVAGTGDFMNIMVADPLPGTWTLAKFGASHDNAIADNEVHSSGPTGQERMASVAPAFVGGIVVLNGTYNNKIVNNQAWANGGGDLAWAQAVPSATSPIGVLAATSRATVLHCNVTASEGGGGVQNLNGNIWMGNIAKTIDPCIPAQGASASNPQIGSFTANPNPVTSGNSTTLTVSNIADTNPSATITHVAIYMDSNGDGKLDSGDTLIGYAMQTSPGVWTLTYTVNLAPGTYTLFAQALDNYGLFSNPFALSLTVQ